MTSLQRIILISALTLSAGIAHFTLCTWGWHEQYGSLIVGYTRVELISAPGSFQMGQSFHYGLVSNPNVDKADAVAFGVVLPVLLLAAALYLAAGWRRAARAERGRCINCGYDLKHQYSAGCSECGWRRTS